MRTDEASAPRSLDVWLIFVIVVMVVAFGGGLWLTGKAILVRLDELSVRTTGRVARLEEEIFALRKQVQDVEFLLRKPRDGTVTSPPSISPSATPPAPPPAPGSGGAPPPAPGR